VDWNAARALKERDWAVLELERFQHQQGRGNSYRQAPLGGEPEVFSPIGDYISDLLRRLMSVRVEVLC
jgi:hypothetical protein